MNELTTIQLGFDLLIILSAGFIAGVVCKRIHVPMVVGYLVIGAVIGQGMLGFFTPSGGEGAPDDAAATKLEQSQSGENPLPAIERPHANEAETTMMEKEILENFAHLGANLLLFAIGIQFAPSELSKTWRYFLVGGPFQMLGVIVPITLVFHFTGNDWKIGLMLGAAAAMSSTVLVYKSLEDMGQVNAPNGVRAVSILLFQDVAIVPILLLMPLLASLASAGGAIDGDQTRKAVFSMIVNSALFCTLVVLLRYVFCRWIMKFLLTLKSLELLLLFTTVLYLCLISVAFRLELPSAIGALAAGVIVSETRLSQQIMALTIPFREVFSAIFFVSLGALLNFDILFQTPIQTIALFTGMIVLKTIASGIALRVIGLGWKPAMAMGLGLAQLGELSFVLLSDGVQRGLFDQDTYQRMLFVALVSIIMTPLFLKIALTWSVEHLISPGTHTTHSHSPEKDGSDYDDDGEAIQNAIVIGLGPIGCRITSFLELSGFDVCLIDMNPVNLHPFAQQGFRTISGDAADATSLHLAKIEECKLVVISVPDDQISLDIVEAVHAMRQETEILVRCHYTANVRLFEAAGAKWIVCEEAETGGGFIRALEKIVINPLDTGKL